MEINIIALIMVVIAILTLAPLLIIAAAIWWRWVKEALGEFNQ